MSYIGIKHRRDTAANWTANNPILLEGQFGYETDSYTDSGSIRYYKFKLGDGVTAWNSLDYLGFNAAGGGGGGANLSYNAATRVVASDSGTDATLTLVDGTNPGLMTSADFTKLAGIEAGATADQSAAEILAALLTVDGAGSGLDADTLDGISSAGFAAALGADDNYVTDAEKVKLSNLSGTNTGDQTTIVGITGTKSQFDTAVTDGNFAYQSDLSGYQPLDSDLTDLSTKWTAASASGSAALQFHEDTDNGTNKITLTAPAAVASDKTITFPDETGTVLTTTSGVAKTAVPCEFIVACSDETTALTTGTAKVTFRAPYAFTVTAVRASVTTAPTGGTLLTVDINENGTTILSTKLTFDASEKTTTTAATAAVISDSSIADDAEITIDIDAVGSTIAGAGLKVYIIGTHAV